MNQLIFGSLIHWREGHFYGRCPTILEFPERNNDYTYYTILAMLANNILFSNLFNSSHMY